MTDLLQNLHPVVTSTSSVTAIGRLSVPSFEPENKRTSERFFKPSGHSHPPSAATRRPCFSVILSEAMNPHTGAASTGSVTVVLNKRANEPTNEQTIFLKRETKG